MKAELVPENGDPPIPIDSDLMVVGRRDYCDIVINHSSLSKRHCVLVKTDGLLVIRDLISTNGTKVKGQKVRWAALLPDDRITLGSYRLRVYLGPDDAPSPSERFRAKMERVEREAREPAGARSIDATMTPAPRAGPFSFGNQTKGFPEPSPLEVPIPSSEHDNIAAPPGGRYQDDGPLIPIVLDDDDEIIDLD
jgi:pSer/pThr/pTyr-binding forkhead associated (FHA) protein